jgi:hypothetical protein
MDHAMSGRMWSFLTALALSVSSSKADEWRVEPGPLWSVEGVIVEAMDVSGLAAVGQTDGLLVSDETRSAQRFQVDCTRKTLVVGGSVDLLPGTGKEADLEGIAASADEKWFYATGSHGVSRKSGEVRPDRSHVFRIATDRSESSITMTTLLPVIESDEKLRGTLGKGSEDGGLDIEGIADRAGTLFFGVRSPSVGGHAFVIEVNAEALFTEASKVAHRTHELALGEGLGLRDLVRVGDGFMLIAGHAMNDKSSDAFVLCHWQGPGGKLARIGGVPKTTGRAEGLLVLDESADKVTVLVVFDGVKNGGPMELTLHKPQP